MAQYVVHKIGFFFNDDCYEIGKQKGNVTAVIFFLEKPNYEDIYKKLSEYYISEYDMYISPKGMTLLPQNINDGQAAQLLSIMELTFHTIVEYGDDEVIDPRAFELNYDEYTSF